jgi:hypothetical protein
LTSIETLECRFRPVAPATSGHGSDHRRIEKSGGLPEHPAKLVGTLAVVQRAGPVGEEPAEHGYATDLTWVPGPAALPIESVS